jgi:tetraacyldisaccharide 4'-kinase
MKTPDWFLEKNLTAWLLLPLSFVYLIAQKIVFNLRLFWQKESKIPVICVGGLLAGGVGKTPVVREIAKLLPNSAVVMRGYKGKKAGKVEKNDSTEAVGDEARMLADSDIPVFVGKNRRKSIKMAETAGFSCVIMDDGFQNPTVKKDFSILVFDESLGIDNDFVLPAGPYRERRRSALKRADTIIVLVKNKKAEGANRVKNPVFLVERETKTDGLFGDFLAFSGIGYPEKFFDALIGRVGLIEAIGFPDHHQFSRRELKELEALAKEERAGLLTTEKDFVRLPADFKKKVKVAPLRIKLPAVLKNKLLSVSKCRAK